MSAISGKKGFVKLDDLKKHKVTNWTFNGNLTLNPSNKMKDLGFKGYHKGLKGGTFTINAYIDNTNVNGTPPEEGDEFLTFELVTDELLRLKIIGDSETTAIVTSRRVGVPVAGIVNYTATCTINGPYSTEYFEV